MTGPILITWPMLIASDAVAAILASVLTALLTMLVVRGPKVPEIPKNKAGEWRSETWVSSGEGLINLNIPHYLRQHLMKSGITTITQVGELCDPPAGVKAKFPYGLGKVRQKIIREAYAEWENSKVKKDIEEERE
jgi:hypothetical protein